MAENKSEMTGFVYDDIGASKMRDYEDRSFFDTVKTRGNLEITLAIVADGVGGGGIGERAADLTINTVVRSIRASKDSGKEISQILGKAIGAANKAVYREARRESHKDGMSATVSVALIYKRRLYVANVGDSRVYLIRNGEAKQITVDHTFATDKIREGVLSPEKAFAHPHAEDISRSVGFEPRVMVDLGLYLDLDLREGKKALASQGMKLNKEDVVLVCSDGLIKETAESESKRKKQGKHKDPPEHYVESKEIVSFIRQYHAEEATKVMVGQAVGRNVDDNVTAVVVEFSGRKVSRFNKQKAIKTGGIIALLSFALFFIWIQLQKTKVILSDIEQTSIAQTELADALTQTAALFTPTPTITPRPPRIFGEVGAIIDENGNRHPFVVEELISSYGFSEVHVNHTDSFDFGKIYMFEQSQIRFDAMPSNNMNFIVFPNSEIFIYPGTRYVGAKAIIDTGVGIVEFAVSGSCMAVHYQGNKISSSCYEGDCTYSIGFGREEINIPVGMQVVLTVSNTLEIENNVDIPAEQGVTWFSVLRNTDAIQCIRNWAPTPVYVAPSPTKRKKDEPRPLPTDTPVPPTDTPKKPPTDTPAPPPTDTPVPPPPTDTPVPPPPTDTPKPKKNPSDTPEPNP